MGVVKVIYKWIEKEWRVVFLFEVEREESNCSEKKAWRKKIIASAESSWEINEWIESNG